MATYYVISILLVLAATQQSIRLFVQERVSRAERLCPPNLTSLIIPLAVLVMVGLARIATISAVIPHDFAKNTHLYAGFIPRDFFLTTTSLSPISWINLSMSGYALIGAIALTALFIRLRVSLGKRELIACAITALAIYIPSYFATTIASADSYAYVAYARMGLSAYRAPLTAVAVGDFAPLTAAVTHAWGSLDPAPYGPAWLALSSAVFGHTQSIEAAIHGNRSLDLTALIVIGYTLWQLEVPLATIIVFLVNPFTAFYFVGDAHNDIVAVALALVGLLFLRKNQYISIIPFILAGLVKAPYMIASMCVLGGITRLRDRIVTALAVVIGTIACSSFFGGRAYLNALQEHARNNSSPLLIRLEHGVLLAIVGYILIRVVCYGKSNAHPAIALTSMTAAVYPWYIGLALPYATATRSLALFALISPILYAVTDPVYNAGILRYALVILLITALVTTQFIDKKNHSSNTSSIKT